MLGGRKVATLGGDKFRDDSSLTLDGTDDYIDCGDVSDWDFDNGSASIFSVSVWFKHDTGSPGTNETLIGKYNTGQDKREWRLSTHTDDKFGVWMSGNGSNTFSTYTSFVLADTNWHHMVLTYDGSVATANLRCQMYVDGIDSTTTGSSSNPAQLNEDDAPLVISGFPGSSSSPGGSVNNEWGGTISEVAIYNNALHEGHVKTLYNGREPYNHKEGVAKASLVAWYRMGDGLENGSGTTIYDMSDNTNNGTMTNMAADDFVGDTP